MSKVVVVESSLCIIVLARISKWILNRRNRSYGFTERCVGRFPDNGLRRVREDPRRSEVVVVEVVSLFSRVNHSEKLIPEINIFSQQLAVLVCFGNEMAPKTPLQYSLKHFQDFGGKIGWYW